MKGAIPLIGVVTCLLAPAVFADDHCHDPVADWQSREALREQLEECGWKVQRIRVDDDCYEVKGTDLDGNRVEARFSPASLKLRELEIRFGHPGSAADYFDGAKRCAPATNNHHTGEHQ